jgi:TolB protein
VAGADEEPSWSADSKKLVYVSTTGVGGGEYEIFTINRDGTGRTAIAVNNVPGDKQWPVFSPDGTKIAFQSGLGDPTKDTDVWVVSAGGGDATNLTSPTAANGFRDEAPSWSPDGKTIAFHSNRRGDFDIWVVNADGTSPTGLTNDPRSDGFPTWSPKGDRIAFTRDREVWTVAADGTSQTQITRRF